MVRLVEGLPHGTLHIGAGTHGITLTTVLLGALAGTLVGGGVRVGRTVGIRGTTLGFGMTRTGVGIDGTLHIGVGVHGEILIGEQALGHTTTMSCVIPRVKTR